MAAALRFAAKRLRAGALSRPPPQAFLTAAKELPTPRRVSLRRPFSSSTESSPSPAPNLHGNNKAEPMTSLSARELEKMQELHDIVRQMSRQQALEFARELENNKLLQDMDRLVRELRAASGSTHEFVENNMGKIVAGTVAATGAVIYIETKFIFPLFSGLLSEKAE